MDINKVRKYYSIAWSACVAAFLLFYLIAGKDLVFTNIYWIFVSVFLLALFVILFRSYRRYKKKYIDYVAAVVYAVYRYGFLISQLVSRDFKSKYKRSVLGVLWSFLNPLLTMVVQ